MMRLPKTIRDNLYFLLAETSSQLVRLQVLLDTASGSIAQGILDRHGYTYNLKMRIHDGCIETLRSCKKEAVDIYSLRAAEATASDLEMLTNLCHDCVCLRNGLKQTNTLKKLSSASLLSHVIQGIDTIEAALAGDDSRFASKIVSIKQKLNRAYNKQYRYHVQELRQNKRPKNTVTSLFVAQRIAEMGDVLVSISESIISAKLGQAMPMSRFRRLTMALADLGLNDAEVQSIAETKSGSAISAISAPNKQGNNYAAVFKEGSKTKLKEERENVESWHTLFPGLAPQILSYKKSGKNAAMLIEHLPGQTFDKILLQEQEEILLMTMNQLCKTLTSIWKETQSQKKSNAHHMKQLRYRLKSVIELHPTFEMGKVTIAGFKVKSINELIDDAERLEQKLAAPFSVYIHGDFNVDNIIYDSDAKKIRFIDLHRSCYQDYTQDVSVFMVSNYRLQGLNKKTRKRVAQLVNQFYQCAAKFARQHKDNTFEVRLALGLARSFISSTRFILDRALARAMFLRGIFILESLSRLSIDQKSYKAYKLPIKALFT